MTIRATFFVCIMAAVSLPARGQIQVLDVTSSANFAAGKLLPGGLASIFCKGLQITPSLVTAEGYPLPVSLAGITVRVDGIPAPILAVANLAGGTYQQINIQIPWSAAGIPGLAFDMSQNGGPPVHFLPAGSGPWPAFFVDPSGYAIAQHASDYRPVTRSDAARPGEWITVYATNLGAVHNQPPDGYPADAYALAPVVADSSPYASYYGLAVGPSADYTSSHIQSNYIGLLPGSIIYQVNLLVPSSAPAGDLAFQLVDIHYCGFFFTQGCGRGFVTADATMPAKVPVSN